MDNKQKTELNKLIDKVSEQTDIDIKYRTRTYDSVCARAVYYRLAYDTGRYTLKNISKSLNRNHATVIHGLKNVFPYMEKYNPRIYNSYKVLSLNASVGGSEISDIINMLHGPPINKISEIKIFIKKITDECNIV